MQKSIRKKGYLFFSAAIHPIHLFYHKLRFFHRLISQRKVEVIFGLIVVVDEPQADVRILGDLFDIGCSQPFPGKKLQRR
ncbi:hypothetical protein D3C81_2155880 [compost metagenome]